MSLRIRTFGDGPHRVLALHCALAHGGAWAGLNLPGVTLIAPDLPGHGGSPDWTGTDYHTDCTRAVLALMDAPMDVVGHSSGATIALRVALERPELVRRLTLIEPVLFAAARASGAPAFADHMRHYGIVAAALRDGDMMAAAAAFHGTWGAGAFAAQPAQVQAYMAERMPLIAALNPALTDDTGGLLAYMRLEGLGIPVLLLEGDRSPAVIAAIQDELLRRLPQATRVIIPGAGHMLPLTHAAQVRTAIAAHQA